MKKPIKEMTIITDRLSKIPLNFENWEYEIDGKNLILTSKPLPNGMWAQITIYDYENEDIDYTVWAVYTRPNCHSFYMNISFYDDKDGMVKKFVNEYLCPTLQKFCREVVDPFVNNHGETQDDDIWM